MIKPHFKTHTRAGRLFGLPPLAFLLTIALVCMAGCTISDPLARPVVNKPEARMYEIKSSVVVKAVKKVLQNKKFSLDPAHSTAPRLETEWLQERSFRSRIVADIRPVSKNSSELKLQIFLEKQSTWQKTWQAVDKIGDRAYHEFFDDVQMECYRVIYDGR